jgi:hypothetical protein
MRAPRASYLPIYAVGLVSDFSLAAPLEPCLPRAAYSAHMILHY